MKRERCSGFGLLIVGSEVLDGRKEDAHFATARSLLAERHLSLVYSMVLPDVPDVLEHQIRWAMCRPAPFFCCGGIGSTPDDHTRDCAARAAGVAIERHAEAVRILKEQFGNRCTSERLRMVDFPAGAVLIPNPVNRVPGFRIRNGHFLPGFPQMAGPMMRWVLQTWYELGQEQVAACLTLRGAKEADLVRLMERFISTHPEVTFSSLPAFTDTGTEVELGLKGLPPAVEAGMADLRDLLDAEGIAHEPSR
jgi:molybdopterin-biosynthesis enzyme MoeA-like protein